jgi:hypothetical protein
VLKSTGGAQGLFVFRGLKMKRSDRITFVVNSQERREIENLARITKRSMSDAIRIATLQTAESLKTAQNSKAAVVKVGSGE